MITLETDQQHEIDNIMKYAMESIAEDDKELAEEYLRDAAYLINKYIDNTAEREQYAAKFTINPLDYAA